VHRSQDSRVVILEYEVHGKILSTGVSYDNRLISVVTIEKRKIVHWRDYMDSLAAWTALNSASLSQNPRFLDRLRQQRKLTTDIPEEQPPFCDSGHPDFIAQGCSDTSAVRTTVLIPIADKNA